MCTPGLACAGSPSTASAPTSSAPSTASRPAGSLGRRLEGADARLVGALRSWRGADPSLRTAPPAAALAAAAAERGIVHRLAGDRHQARRVLGEVPRTLARTIRADLRAARELRRLTGPPTALRLRLRPPLPAGVLLSDYRLAQRRFGVRWEVLAAVNLVESAFGRVVNHSRVGARGPMQFLPATWRAYGLGGDVYDAHDAVLGAANYLHRSGAPGHERRALEAYNPSPLYVDAVLIYARAMARDPLGYLRFYAWEASLPPA